MPGSGVRVPITTPRRMLWQTQTFHWARRCTISTTIQQRNRLSVWARKNSPAMAASDDQAANDFVLTVPRTNCITEVRVMGEYSQGGGPASSFNVYFYKNRAGNLPGALMAAFMNLPHSGTPPDFVIL